MNKKACFPGGLVGNAFLYVINPVKGVRLHSLQDFLGSPYVIISHGLNVSHGPKVANYFRALGHFNSYVSVTCTFTSSSPAGSGVVVPDFSIAIMASRAYIRIG